MNFKVAVLAAATAAMVASAMISPSAMAKGGGGGGGGGGGTSCDTRPVLPTLAPAPDVLIRESFGAANLARPKGDKGCNATTYLSTAINGFWVEYPGNKDNGWIALGESNQTWRLCAVSSNIYEMPSPLQGVNNEQNGCMVSDWHDPVATRPMALLPFSQPAGPYEIHLDLWPGPYYVGFGVTDSAALDRNLESVGGLWFELGNPDANNQVTYNVRVNGRTGPVLATGLVPWAPWMPVDLRYDPVTGTASASLNEVELGAWLVGAIRTPRYIGIEGVGVVDNLVVYKLF